MPATAGYRRAWHLFLFRAHDPSAMACLDEDLEACLVHLTFPREHHVRPRTTNLLGRAFGGGRRGTKVIGRVFTEAACLQLVFAILRQLDAIRHQLFSTSHMGQVSDAATYLQEM